MCSSKHVSCPAHLDIVNEISSSTPEAKILHDITLVNIIEL